LDAKALLAHGSPGSALSFAEDALVNAADAVLRKDGWRVKGKTQSHEARFDYPGLPKVFSQSALVGQLRNLRNAEIYGTSHPVSKQQATDAITLAENAIAAVAPLIP